MKEIAAALNVSARTVESHKYHMIEMLGLRTTADLVRYAVQMGFVPGPPTPASQRARSARNRIPTSPETTIPVKGSIFVTGHLLRDRPPPGVVKAYYHNRPPGERHPPHRAPAGKMPSRHRPHDPSEPLYPSPP